MMKRCSFAVVLTIALVLSTYGRQVCAEPTRVVYPNIDGWGTESLGYQVLALALEKSGQPYRLELQSRSANHNRIREMLETNEISVADFGTSAEYERDLLPIYFPIDRGLNGWRLFVIPKQRTKEFGRIKNIYELRKFTMGLGADWSDVGIYKHAGFRVVKAPLLENLFPMVNAGRFDALPLGMNEVYDLFDRYRDVAPEATIDTHLLLVYPFGRLFFVSRKNVNLRNIILTGLMRAFEDGSFQKLFEKTARIEETMAFAQITNRTVIKIDNKDLTEKFRQIPRKYFLDPEKICKNKDCR